MGTDDTLAQPLYSIRNTADRWLTVTNHDLIVFEDVIVVSTFHGYRDVLERRVIDSRLGATRGRVGVRRAFRDRTLDDERIARSIAAVRAGDRGDVIRIADVAAARFGKRMGVVTLRLTLLDGKRRKFMWTNTQRSADLANARAALSRMLGSKLAT